MGMHGHKHVNAALDECDLLVNIGARFDDRATGKIAGFAPNAKIIHVDIDPAEIGKNVRTDVPVVGDAREVLKMLLPEVEDRQHDDGWPGSTRARSRAASGARRATRNGRSPIRSSRRSREATNGEAIVTTDVGQHQMWAAQHFGFDHPNRWLTSGVSARWAIGLPSAIGARSAGRTSKSGRSSATAASRCRCNELATASGEARYQYRGDQQRLSRHGSPVAGSLPRQELLRGRDRRVPIS